MIASISTVNENIMAVITTSVLLPTVLEDQINYLVDCLVELQIKFSESEISLREYNVESESIHSQLELLRKQKAHW